MIFKAGEAAEVALYLFRFRKIHGAHVAVRDRAGDQRGIDHALEAHVARIVGLSAGFSLSVVDRTRGTDNVHISSPLFGGRKERPAGSRRRV